MILIIIFPSWHDRGISLVLLMVGYWEPTYLRINTYLHQLREAFMCVQTFLLLYYQCNFGCILNKKHKLCLNFEEVLV